MGSYRGKVTAETVEARFANAGKIATVCREPGDEVKAGETLAAQDRKQLQTVLDRELADYEKARAEFEIFVLNNPNPADQKTQYEKKQAQAALDVSVNAVELAKYTLDETELKSPVNGIVIDNNGLRSGMYITPGSYAYQILDTDTLTVELEIDVKDIKQFTAGVKVKIKLGEEERGGMILPIIPALNGQYTVRIKPDSTEKMTVGETADIDFP